MSRTWIWLFTTVLGSAVGVAVGMAFADSVL
jgi:hypothetical protein